MKYHNSLYKHKNVFFILNIPAGIDVPFVKCMCGIY